jgi:L-ornithine N5-oxygenase
MLEVLYAERYLDRLCQRNGRRMITMVDITGARAEADEIVLELTDRRTGGVTELRRDLVFLGTGFSWEPPQLIRRLADAIGLDRIDVTRQYRLVLAEPAAQPATAACYLQGVNEATHGIADSLLSVLAHRAGEITLDILAHRAGPTGVGVPDGDPARGVVSPAGPGPR